MNRSPPRPWSRPRAFARPRRSPPRPSTPGPSTHAAGRAGRKPDAGGPRWTELSPAHRKVLAPLANDWNGLDARSKERWIDVAGRYPKMTPDEQQRANQRMGEWSHMTVAQRTQARMNFQETRSLSKEEREARWKAYQALPEEKKRELAAKRVAARRASGAVRQRRRGAPPRAAAAGHRPAQEQRRRRRRAGARGRRLRAAGRRRSARASPPRC